MKVSLCRRRWARIQTGLVVAVMVVLTLNCFASENVVADIDSSHEDEEKEVQQARYANGNNNDDSSFRETTLLELVQEAITDASRPLHPERRDEDTIQSTSASWTERRPPPYPRWEKWKRTLAKMLSSSSAASHAVVVTYTPSQQQQQVERTSPAAKRTQKRTTTTSASSSSSLTTSDTGDMFDYEMHEGARLISASFGLVSNTLGLIADGVRISGDTAAGFVGSSVRLLGTTVKSVSGSFESAGRALEPTDERMLEKRRRGLTSERLRERQLGNGNIGDDFSHGGIVQNARNVASQSARLVGSVIRGVGDAMLLAGEATETIASSTTGVAENVVRLVEDFAGTIASATSFSEREQRRAKAKVRLDSIRQKEKDAGADTTFVTFGSYDIPSIVHDEDSEIPVSSEWERNSHTDVKESSFVDAIELAADEFWKLVEFAMADTQGVPSFAGELLGVIILCYLAALWLVSSSTSPRRRDDGPDIRPNEIIHITHATGDDETSLLSQGLSDSQSTERRGAKASRCSWFVVVLLLPFRTFFIFLSMARRTIFNRLTLLLVFYGGAWVYLCRASQLRSSAIQRNAEGAGYRSAIESIGRTSHSMTESVAWLNALMSQIWRVSYDTDTEEGSNWANLSSKYPKFVRRSIRDNTYGRRECRSCDWDGGRQLFGTPDCDPYGGIEPYLSSKIGTFLIDALGNTRGMKVEDVAYVSLYSFTLGSEPPLLRSVEFLGTSRDRSKIHFKVEVDALLEDLSLVLEVKLSSLEYALLPSTKVSVHAIDVTLPLKVTVHAIPDYPYVSTLELSLFDAPECNVRITPLSGESGLRGVDVGSLPLIREWVRDTIRETLSEYVAPNYVAIDLASWFKSAPTCERTGIPTHSLAGITQLRQKTRALVNPNPRTPSSGALSMTSVAETLPSHRAAGGTAFIQENTRSAFDSARRRKDLYSLIKPTTELSRRGMDRWIEKLQKNEVREPKVEESLLRLFSRPLAMLSPVLVAIAATVFTDRLAKDKD